MKILYLINGLGVGGAERSLAEMLPVLREQGVDATVAYLNERDEGVQAEVEEAGFPVHHIRSTGWIGRTIEVRRLLRRLTPSIVHTTLFESDVIGRVASVGQNVTVVTSLVNTTYGKLGRPNPQVPRWKLEAVRAIDGWTARRLTDHHHAITEAVRDSMTEALGINPVDVSVILRGRDEDRLGLPSPERRSAARQRLGVPPSAKVIVNVGRQEHQKAQVDLLRAVRLLAGRHPDVVLLQAGRQGQSSAEIARLAADPALEGRIRLLGHRTDVPEILAAGDVFAFPSLYEGLGGAVIEAMALGLPIVATSLPPLREVVEEGANALLVPPAEPARLAEALDALLSDPNKRASFGQCSRDIYEERFTIRRSVEEMARMYQRLLNSRVTTRSQPRWLTPFRRKR